MDLDSPFLKTALVKGKTGEVEEREIRNAKMVGGGVEMETMTGALALFPQTDVVAILPRLPSGGEVYGPADVDRALALLRGLSAPLSQRPEASAETLAKWRDLKKPAEVAEAARQEEERKAEEGKRRKLAEEQEAKVQAWKKEAADFLKPRTAEDLALLRRTGESLLPSAGTEAEKVMAHLAVLSQVKPKEQGGPLSDWNKLSEFSWVLVPQPLLGWLVGGVVVASFLAVLFGLVLLSSGLTVLRNGGWLIGPLWLAMGVGLLGTVGVMWWPKKQNGEVIPAKRSEAFSAMVPYLGNQVQSLYYLPAQQFVLPARDFAAGIQSLMAPAEQPFGLFKAKLAEGVLTVEERRWRWRQPVTALGMPVGVAITASGLLPELETWSTPTVDRVEIGRIALPDPVAPVVSEAMLTSLVSGLERAGLTRIRLQPEGKSLQVSVPASGKQPTQEVKLAQVAKLSEAVYRKEISAEELAQALVDRKGKEFLDKFVLVSGRVHSVGGSNFTSGGKLGRDQLDEIYLMGVEDFYGRGRPLLVKCLIKSDCLFQMDSRGDLYMRYVKQEFDQERKKKTQGEDPSEKKLKFLTLDDIEVSGPGVDAAKERPLVSRGKRLKFLRPQRMELNAEEVRTGTASGGISGRPPGSNQAGHIELYGLTLVPGGKVETILREVEQE